MSDKTSPYLAGGSFRRFRLGIAALCALLLMTMMGLTVADVLGRYLRNAPVAGATELTEMLLAAVIFIGLPAASLDGEHIAVDLLTGQFGDRVRRLMDTVVSLFSGLVLGVIAWRLWAIGDQIAGYGGTTPTLKLPIAPLGYGLAVLTALAAIVTVWHGLTASKYHGGGTK